MIEQNPLKIFLEKQDNSTFTWAKYSLAVFQCSLFLTTILLYTQVQESCPNYKVCFILLLVFHIVDGLTYIHQGR